jgi:rhodanese-related sulfurtransferase
MKNRINSVLLVAFISINFIACGQKSSTKEQNNEVEQAAISLISPEDLNQANKDIQLIDVRKPEEFSSGHLENAVNMNFYDDDFEDQIQTLDKSKEVYLYCRSGGRSGKAAQKLEEMGFTKVYDLEGGILNWEKQNLPLVK